MDLSIIKQALPHVERVWVKDGQWFIHYQPNAEEIDLNNITQAEPVKPSKKK